MSREARRRIAGETVGELRSRISDAMARSAREPLMRSEGGVPNLAVISSVAPFVGLFGTVWGIMSTSQRLASRRTRRWRRLRPASPNRSRRQLMD